MTVARNGSDIRPVWVWGLPLAPLTFAQTLDRVDGLIDAGKPGFFITANLHYAMISNQDPRLAEVNRRAAFIVADGMPLVWASRWQSRRLPERVTGADLVVGLCEQAARRGQRVFLLGGAPGVAQRAAHKLGERFPELTVAGTAAPRLDELTPAEHAQLLMDIRRARPDLLFVAFGQPKGELWLARNIEALGVPAAVQIGASLDFLAGMVVRAPRWMQCVGLEWAFRLAQEPARLGGRYTANARFACRMLARDLASMPDRRRLIIHK
jgi:N-acetylglucosaminyldiphosphoundecaprenol N-acetyl-beta-D-mannosaminyltransferase